METVRVLYEHQWWCIENMNVADFKSRRGRNSDEDIIITSTKDGSKQTVKIGVLLLMGEE